MKIIYSVDDCGYPICIKISNTVLKRVEEIQSTIKDLAVQKNESLYCTKFVPELFKISEHTKSGLKPYIEISSNFISLYLSGHEGQTELLEFKNLFEIPNIYFIDQFVYYCVIMQDYRFKKIFKFIPAKHIKILKKLMDVDKYKKVRKEMNEIKYKNKENKNAG